MRATEVTLVRNMRDFRSPSFPRHLRNTRTFLVAVLPLQGLNFGVLKTQNSVNLWWKSRLLCGFLSISGDCHERT